MRKKKGNMDNPFDKGSYSINRLLLKIPYLGKHLSKLYLWKFMVFNYMLVGASGLLISWILYEGFLRNLFVSIWGGTFLAMIITTALAFMWNFTLNKYWSLGINSHILKLKKAELQDLHEKIVSLLDQKFDRKGRRIL